MRLQTFGGRAAALIGQSVQVATSVDTIVGTLMWSDDTFIRVATNGVGGYGNERMVTILTSSVAYIRTTT